MVRYRVEVVAAVVAAAIFGLLMPRAGGETLFAFAAVALPAVLLLLGEPGRGRAGRLVGAVVASGILLTGGLGLLMRVAGSDPTGVWILGLPRGLAIQIWVMALLPLLVIGVLFALDFERFRPAARDLERIRSLADDDT